MSENFFFIVWHGQPSRFHHHNNGNRIDIRERKILIPTLLLISIKCCEVRLNGKESSDSFVAVVARIVICRGLRTSKKSSDSKRT